jgi:hypothetical protein
VPNAEAFGQGANFRGFVLTELQKPAQTITKFSQALVIRLVKRLSGAI